MESIETEEKKPKDSREIKPMTKSELVSFAFDLGFTISIPIVILTLGGRFVDKKFETAPLFMIIGLLISVITTGYLIWRKTKTLL